MPEQDIFVLRETMPRVIAQLFFRFKRLGVTESEFLRLVADCLKVLSQTACCARCGKQLGQTSKMRKPSKSKLCPVCRVRKWREAHPEEARELNRATYLKRKAAHA